MVLAFAAAGPVQDTQIVESTIREVRAAPPTDLLLAGKYSKAFHERNDHVFARD